MFRRIQDFFVKTVNRVEGNKTPFIRYYFLFAAILTIRLALEFFSSRRLFRTDDILHIGLWFIFIVLAFVVQLTLFSGEKMIRVARLAIVFFSIALTAPLIDLLVTGGIGAKMNYLSLHSWKDVLWSYFTIGGPGFSRGATLGIRIEILILVMASFNYVRTKRKSLAWAFAASISIYTVLFLSGSVPLLLGYLVSKFQLHYQAGDQSTVLLLLTVDLILFCTAFCLHAPKRMIGILRNTPWSSVCVSALLATCGALLALKNYPQNWSLTPTTLFWFPLFFAWVICMGAYAGVQRKIKKGETDSATLQLIANSLVFFMFITGVLLPGTVFFCIILTWALIFILYESPLRLSEVPILKNLLEALVFLSASITGFCSFNAPMIGYPVTWIAVITGAGLLLGIAIELAGKKVYFRKFEEPGKSVLIKGIVSALVIGAFLLVIYGLPEDKSHGLVFLFASLPPLGIIWYDRLENKYFLYSFLPGCLVLVLLTS